MTVTVAAAQSAPRARRATLALLEEVFGEIRTDRFAVRLWDGTEWGSPHAGCTLVLAHPGALRTMLLRPSELSLGEAFVFGDVDVEGELEAIFPVAERLLERNRGLAERARLARRLLALPRRPRPHDRERRATRLRGRRHSLPPRPAGGCLPLRRLERLLRPLPRPQPRLLVRVLLLRTRFAGRGAGAQGRPHLQKARASRG